MSSAQIALKAQDLFVLLKLAAAHRKGIFFTFASLGQQLEMSSSRVHASIQRARIARLIGGDGVDPSSVDFAALREFVIHGARYAFPPMVGSIASGIPTAHAAPPLRSLVVQSEELPPVWPTLKGYVRGVALTPLHDSVPAAASRDGELYELLALFDALRSGAARERELAARAIEERLA